LSVDYQIITAETSDKLQEAVCKLTQTVRKYNLNTSSKKTKVMEFARVEPVRAKFIVNGKAIEQVRSTFKYKHHLQSSWTHLITLSQNFVEVQ
jgi:hypothetical protein